MYGKSYVAKPILITGSLINIRTVSCGHTHSGFIDRKNRIYMYGGNDVGELGLSNFTERNVPTQISCGGKYIAFITPDRKIMFGIIWCI